MPHHVSRRSIVVALLAGIALATPHGAAGQTAEPQQTAATAAAAEAPEDFDDLVVRIALYPDPLLELVLQASTLPLQIVEADRFLKRRASEPKLQPKPNWGPSIVGMLNYPTVVTMMSDDLDWTTKLGEAVLGRLDGVQQSIQQVRSQLHAAGRLTSNDRQTVSVTAETIRVEPAQADALYVPVYDAETIMTAPPIEVAPVGTTSTVVVSDPWVTYSAPYPAYWGPGAGFVGGAVLGGMLGYAIGDHYDHDFHGPGPRPGPGAGAPVARPAPAQLQSQLRANAGARGGGLKATAPAASRATARPAATANRPAATANRPTAAVGDVKRGQTARKDGVRGAQSRASSPSASRQAGSRPRASATASRPSSPGLSRAAPSRSAFSGMTRGDTAMRQSSRGAQVRAGGGGRGGGGGGRPAGGGGGGRRR